jgi:starch synthase (maltosyl-transferring)
MLDVCLGRSPNFELIAMKPIDGRKRVVIEDVTPQIDAGGHAARRVTGDEVVVNAAIFADGHYVVAAQVLHRHESESAWRVVPMRPLDNDLWEGAFIVDKLGTWRFTVQGWIDHFATWASVETPANCFR